MPDLEVLAFARDHRPSAAADVAMRALFGSPARYYQRLARALEDPAALRHDPEVVYRLRRIRDARSDQRSAKRFRRVNVGWPASEPS
ncbi:DUF3263 domain-containing protein [Rathayibacter sp. VKM Ac-2630]|uniref:DUF3263 domain-containing protein n=1 Tax=Rathayibacter sp. VKM Ac-2630 TaxID=1938617 RepID=UPI0009818C83|nr:DUF3263 domain-containing protein [Rathayibacter sp. VKM Ac-2630]OOB89222.1 hypothetical protein B0T42_18755 [Rathayibacter sp. VKM Ac-2630]